MASIDIDSAFAKAYTGLAFAYWDRFYWESYFKENFMDTCLIIANTALSFDDKLDEAYYMKGRYYYENAQNEKAMDNFETALKINPNYYSAYIYKGYILTYVIRDYVKGLETFYKALDLISGDERPSLLRELGESYRCAGFFDKAKDYIQEAYMAAKKEVEQLKKTGVLPLIHSHRIGYAFWKVGKYKEAEHYFNEQIKYGIESLKLGRSFASTVPAYYDLAATYAFLGDKNKAYQYLDEFNTMNFYPSWLVSLAKHDPLFDSIRNEERFQKILQNMEAKYQAEHERVRKWLEEQGML